MAWLQRRWRNWQLTTEYVARGDTGSTTLQLLEASYAKVRAGTLVAFPCAV